MECMPSQSVSESMRQNINGSNMVLFVVSLCSDVRWPTKTGYVLVFFSIDRSCDSPVSVNCSCHRLSHIVILCCCTFLRHESRNKVMKHN